MQFHHLIAWGLFLAVVLVLLSVDLFVLHRKPHAIHIKEALIGALIPMVAALLSACPRLRILATSRTALRIYGEHEYPLAPLPVPAPDGDPQVIARSA